MSAYEGFEYRKLSSVFNINSSKQAILKAEKEGKIPQAERIQVGGGKIAKRVWTYDQLPDIGAIYGFLKKPNKPVVMTTYASKGGCFKTTIALNEARAYALHGVKTIVIDLDPQGDASCALGLDIDEEDIDSIKELDDVFTNVYSLYDFAVKNMELKNIIQNTEIPTLDFIPGNDELCHLEDILKSKNKREYWLKENIVDPLKELGYEMIIIDLPPAWGTFASMAILASDIVLCPLECSANHYKNHTNRIKQMNLFMKNMNISPIQMYIPVKVNAKKILAMEIKRFYTNNVDNCTDSFIRESVVGDEAMVNKLSLIEYAPTKILGEEFRMLLLEIDAKVQSLA